MRNLKAMTAGLAAMTLVAACGEQSDAPEDAVEETAGNVLLAEWTGPYEGVPAFDKMNLADLKPALEEGMAMNLAEIDRIAANPEPASFENTIEAMENTGRDLGRVFTYWGIWIGNLSTPEFREVRREMAPKLAEFNSKVTQNAALFARIRAVYEGQEMATLRPDQQRLTLLYYEGFARNGATLEGEAKERYAAINKRLAELHTQFSSNVLSDEEGLLIAAKWRRSWPNLTPRSRRMRRCSRA